MHRRALPKNRETPGASELRRYAELFRQSLKESTQLALVLFCPTAVLVLNLIFFFKDFRLFWLLLLGLPLSVVLGVVLFFLVGYLQRLQVRVADSAGRLHAAFLLFFLFILSFVSLYFLMLALPLGLLLKLFADLALAVDYQRWSLDLAAVHSMIFWTWAVFRRP